MQILIEQAAQAIKEADALIITAGAGMGVDSGLPDFRGNEGFWKAYPALGKARMDFTEAASPQNFECNLPLAWGFYGHRLNLYRRTNPHHGFSILKQWGEQKRGGYWVFTSNVDGQFQRAGFDAKHIKECHGSIHHLQCTEPCTNQIWSADDFIPEVDEAHCLLTNQHPCCPHCGAPARPNILMFSDWGWVPDRTEQQTLRQNQWLDHVKNPVIIEMGAGVHIATVRAFSERTATRLNATLIRINPRDVEVNTPKSIGLAMGALEALNAIETKLEALL